MDEVRHVVFDTAEEAETCIGWAHEDSNEVTPMQQLGRKTLGKFYVVMTRSANRDGSGSVLRSGSQPNGGQAATAVPIIASFKVP